MADSSVMGVVPADIRARFNTVLTMEWLPGKSVGGCLYRGSRDGMTARAFHAACDGKGATLTLIRADVDGAQYVFGGYTSTPWDPNSEDHDEDSEWLTCPDTFLFSVTSPHPGGSVTRFPLKPGYEGKAIRCYDGYGPAFGEATLVVRGHNATGHAVFNGTSYCSQGSSYASFQDILRKGNHTFTGAYRFTPVEIEVYRVAAVTGAPSE